MLQATNALIYVNLCSVESRPINGFVLIAFISGRG